MTVTYSAEADDDLADIYSYTQTTWGFEQANRYAQRLRHGAQHIANHPRIGLLEPDLGQDVRSFLVEEHRVIYRPVGADSIRILRVIHPSRLIVVRDIPR